MIPVDCIWNGKADLGESPVWVADEGRLYWVDIEQARLFQFEPNSQRTRSWQFPSRLTSVAPRAPGRFVGAFANELVLLDITEDRVERLMAPEDGQPDNRFNDGKLDSEGRYWVGTMNEKGTHPSGALYCLDGQLQCRRMDEGYVISNGPAFSPDGRHMFVADSARRTVFRMELDETGDLREKSEWLRFDSDMGLPDGMTVDSEGNLWVCHWGGCRVTRFSPNGRILSSVFLPVSNVTSCCFGGADLSTLYITSARQGLSLEELRKQPLAGGVFSCRPGVRGLPSPNFLG